MKELRKKNNPSTKITEVFSDTKTLEEVFLKLLLSQQAVIRPKITELNTQYPAVCHNSNIKFGGLANEVKT